MSFSRLRYVGLALIVLAVLSGVIITSSTSTTTTDRSLSVSVADDTDAYVALEDCAVRNHHQTDVVAELIHNGTTETVRLAPGEQHSLSESGTLKLTVTEADRTVETELSREISCSENDV